MSENNITKAEYDQYTFGQFLRKRRMELGISCRQLAKMINMSPVYLSDIERGNRKAPIKTEYGKEYMEKLIKHLKINPEEVESFYEMALSTRVLNRNLQDYIKNNKYAFKAIWLAKEVGLSDDEWKHIISYIEEKH